MADKLSIGNVLVVVDGTDSGVHAARYAIRFAALHKAKLAAIAVVDTATLRSLLKSNILVEAELQEFDQELEVSAQSSLNYVNQLASAAGVSADLSLRKGPTHSVVIEEARRRNPDVLVMGAFSTSLIRRDISARERRLVVDEVKCPVLLVP